MDIEEVGERQKGGVVWESEVYKRMPHTAVIAPRPLPKRESSRGLADCRP